MVEIHDHPWFVCCQFHPEFRSRPGMAHPLFREFVRAAVEHSAGGGEDAVEHAAGKATDAGTRC
jgi:CTP synthase